MRPRPHLGRDGRTMAETTTVSPTQPRRISNSHLYYFYAFLTALQFHGPVLVLFLQSHGLRMTEIMLLQSWFTVLLILVDLPSSVLADVIGTKPCVVLASFLQGAALMLYSRGHAFGDFLVAECLAGLAAATMMGVGRAFAYQVVGAGLDDQTIKRLFVVASSVSLASATAGGLAGPFLAAHLDNYALPLALSGATTLLAAIPLISIQAARPSPTVQGPRSGRVGLVERWRTARPHLSRSGLFIYLCSDVVVYGVAVRLGLWCVQPTLRLVGVPVGAFGVVYAMSSLLPALLMRVILSLEKRIGSQAFRICSRVGVTASILLLGVARTPWTVVPGFLFLSLFSAARGALYGVYLNQVVPTELRSTFLSLSTVAHNILYSILSPLIGVSVDRCSVFGTYLGMGVLLSVGTVLFRKELSSNEGTAEGVISNAPR